MKVLVATFCAVDKQQHNLALEVWSSTGVRHWRLCASVLLTKNPLENGIERDSVSPSRTKREEQAHESDAIASDRLVNASQVAVIKNRPYSAVPSHMHRRHIDRCWYEGSGPGSRNTFVGQARLTPLSEGLEPSTCQCWAETNLSEGQMLLAHRP
ncbi:hypothetical protein FDECE_11016 [Fusarium decemcellulare]|nr:hypothetical protein FDECE_11016 [Fusarium decemcellulare]